MPNRKNITEKNLVKGRVSEGNFRLNFHYATIHGTYWMYFGVLAGFSSVFLLSKGYKNSEIGIILALANILAVLVQPFLAELADRGKKRTIFLIIGGITFLNMVLSLWMSFLGERSLGLTAVFILCYSLMMTNQPFINAVNRRLEETGAQIAFGTCRSLGSLAFAIMTFVLGIIVEKRSPAILPWIGCLVLILVMAVVYATYRSYQNMMVSGAAATLENARVDTVSAPKIEENITLAQFIKSHRIFFIMSLGTMWIFFANTVPNAFMAQIVGNVGGGSADVGRIFSFLALTEIPTMILFDRLYRKFSLKGMLKFASIAFAVWLGAMMLATSVNMLSLAQLCHFFSFPIFLPGMVRFIDDNMREGEAVKGQTLFTVMMTVGNMLASLVGGVVLDLAGTKALMMVSTLAAIIGTIIIFVTIEKKETR